jgi:plastocyanin
MHRTMAVRSAAIAAALSLLLAACGGSSPAASSGNGAGGGEQISNFAFNPASMTVKAGTALTWTNADNATHTVSADDGSFDSGNVASGATFSHTFATAGTFAYHCNIHSSMKGTITVTQ